jgi:hypothetical protein
VADVIAICEGIAANLATIRTADPTFIKQVHPVPLDSPTAPSLMVHGVVEMDYTTFGGPGVEPGMEYLVGVEAWLGKASEIGAHLKLRRLLAPIGDESLVAAVEAEGSDRRRLTARLDIDGVLTENLEPACESIAFEEYRGQTNFLHLNGTQYLTAVWIFRVVA